MHLMPLPMHKLYQKYKSKIPNAISIWKELVTLPLHPLLKMKEIKKINLALNEYCKKYLSNDL